MTIPDFTQYGYRVDRELGHNRSSGRVTYLATRWQTDQPVVIKQFQFAKTGASWSDYKAHEQEIQLLQQLDHPGIPKYLGSLETEDGFCLIQEFKNAPSLAQKRSWTLDQIKQVTIAVLEILVYLQQQEPPLIHRDLKPENILVSEALQVYLVDFGLARSSQDQLSASTTVKGTLGFMPPEQLFNRPLTKASDLYGLGATIICLLTGTPSLEIGQLLDENYHLNFQTHLPKLSPNWIIWLGKMTEPNPQNRYPDAATALHALKTIDQLRPIQKSSKLLEMSGLLAGLGLIVTAAGGLLSWLLFTPQFPTDVKPTPITSQFVGDCPGCDLRRANFQDQTLLNLNLTKADLRHANLQGANLSNANLQEADLRDTQGQRASFSQAQLEDADLRGADFQSADFQQANLEDADLRDTDLRGANLRNANLKKAKLEGANLNSTELRGATMPDGSIHP